ncbi:hypothetical protein NADFUDRAFT_72132 [Nadsonia fulvescens var. elongata DSM 6958]|uniref:Calcipressin n=1 Tax=Nadsonia fulvescens var. elongata DSM 6958 TaxID=857566 RepID=A0A1E3PD76_9ASCO|nr:hypothetical protein NADFUDRAFT_72132 [Nadsonia fulvescens var. elongata DSM 6958]
MTVSPSNTLVITGLNVSDFTSGTDNTALDNNTSFVQGLHDRISVVASIAHWAPLKSFRRIVAVFDSVEGAIKARALVSYITHHSDENVSTATLPAATNENADEDTNLPLRAYFAENTPESALNRSSQNHNDDQLASPVSPQDANHLQLPATGRLFFISPPPSPPVGWASKLEDEPNPVALCPHSFAEALHVKLTPAATHTEESKGSGNASAASSASTNSSALPNTAASMLPPAMGKPHLTRKVTLYSSTRDISAQKFSPLYVESPTIVLECFDDGQTVGETEISDDKFDRMRSIRTEIPPTF